MSTPVILCFTSTEQLKESNTHHQTKIINTKSRYRNDRLGLFSFILTWSPTDYFVEDLDLYVFQ